MLKSLVLVGFSVTWKILKENKVHKKQKSVLLFRFHTVVLFSLSSWLTVFS